MTATVETFEETLAPAARARRSPAAIAGGIAVLAALPLAITIGLTLGGGDGVVVHMILALGMVLVLPATPNFRMPPVLTRIGRTGIAAMGTIFFLQGLADALPIEPLVTLAFGDISQVTERFAIYPILIWFAAVLAYDSKGKTRLLGVVVMSILFAAELYSLWLVLGGGMPDSLSRALYLLPFLWLALEGSKASQTGR